MGDDLTIHSFVIRIWIEEIDTDTRRALWRGHITHTESMRREHFERLDGIAPFIERCLRPAGGKLDERESESSDQ